MHKFISCLAVLLVLAACQKDNSTPDQPTTPTTPLKVDSTKLSFPGVSNVVDSFTIQYSGKWTITVNPSTTTWLKLNTLAGTGNTKLYVTVQEDNASGTNKTATLTITPDGNTAQAVNIAVTQQSFLYTPWRQVYGGSDNEAFNAVVAATNGGYVAVGITWSNNGDVTSNQGNADLWVVKVDKEGNKLWQKTYGGTGSEIGNAIVATPDGGYLLAGTINSNNGDVANNHGSNDVWVVKIDANGNKLWQKTYGGSSDDMAFSIIATNDGHYLLAGSSSSLDGDVSGVHAVSGTSMPDAWLLKIDATGNKVWNKAYGSTSVETAVGVVQSADGGFVVLGGGAADFTGGDVSPVHGWTDYWVFKISAGGQLLWQKPLGGSAADHATSIKATPDGGYILAGNTVSNDGDVTGYHPTPGWPYRDGWIVKLDGNGNKQWQKTLGGFGDDDVVSVVPVTGGYWVTGTVSSTNSDVSGVHGFYDAWVVKLDNSGTIVSQKAYGGTQDDGATSLIATGNNTFLLTGKTKSIDGDIVGQHGKEDAWLISFRGE